MGDTSSHLGGHSSPGFSIATALLTYRTVPQTRRHGWGIPRPCPANWLLVPPKWKLCPPKRELCCEEINRLGASGAQIEVQIRVFCGLTPDFLTFLGWRPFFFRDHLFLAGKTAWISCNFSEDLFFSFFGDHLFLTGKTSLISDFGRKISLTFCSSFCLFDPDWDKFLVPPCLSRIHSK